MFIRIGDLIINTDQITTIDLNAPRTLTAHDKNGNQRHKQVDCVEINVNELNDTITHRCLEFYGLAAEGVRAVFNGNHVPTFETPLRIFLISDRITPTFGEMLKEWQAEVEQMEPLPLKKRTNCDYF